MAGAGLEMLAGEPQAAERELRDAIRTAQEMGASRYVALYRTRIAHVLIAQGRDDDALAELEQARETYDSATGWKTARARVLARRGRVEEAVRLAREAVAAMAGNDDITTHAEPSSTSPRCSARWRPGRRGRGPRRGDRAPRGEGQRAERGALPPASGGSRGGRGNEAVAAA